MPKNTRSNKKSHNKSIKNNSFSSSATKITKTMLELLNTIKLYHWFTKDFSTHKATDELYSSLSGNIDKFVEVYMGTLDKRINLGTRTSLVVYTHSTREDFKRYILQSIKYLEYLKLPSTSTDLYNIRDEILGDLKQFIYLYSLH